MAKDVSALKATLSPKALVDLEENESLQAKGMRCMDQAHRHSGQQFGLMPVYHWKA